MNGWKTAADIRIVKLGLGWRTEQVAIDLGWHIAVTIDGAVDELDFECVEAFAITDCRQSVRMDRLTRNAGSDLALLSRPCGIECKQRNCDDDKTGVALHGTHNSFNNVFQRAQASSRAFRFSPLASGFSPSRMNP